MNRWDLGGDRKSTWLRNNKQTIRFYININNKDGVIFAIYFNLEFPTQEFASASADCRMNVNIYKAHELLCNINEYATRAASKALGW